MTADRPRPKTMNRTPAYWAIVPAAGVGRRMASDRPKQYLTLLGQTVIEYSLQRLLALPRIEAVVVAISPEDQYWPQLSLSDRRIETVSGGDERHHSVYRALSALETRADDNDWVLVHDAARPCVTVKSIQRLMDQLADHPVGGLLGHPLGDTLKKVDSTQKVERTIDRGGIWAAATPQMFRYGLLVKALEKLIESGAGVTDEAMAIEAMATEENSPRPQMVMGRRDNLKITLPGDLELASLILQSQSEFLNQVGD